MLLGPHLVEGGTAAQVGADLVDVISDERARSTVAVGLITMVVVVAAVVAMVVAVMEGADMEAADMEVADMEVAVMEVEATILVSTAHGIRLVKFFLLNYTWNFHHVIQW